MRWGHRAMTSLVEQHPSDFFQRNRLPSGLTGYFRAEWRYYAPFRLKDDTSDLWHCRLNLSKVIWGHWAWALLTHGQWHHTNSKSPICCCIELREFLRQSTCFIFFHVNMLMVTRPFLMLSSVIDQVCPHAIFFRSGWVAFWDAKRDNYYIKTP